MERILLVNDETIQRAPLAEALRGEGHDVTIAASGEEALELSESVPVDLVVAAERLPGMDGLELVRALRALRPWLPAIVTTARGSLEAACKALRLGAADYLVAPFEPPELCASAARALAMRRRAREAASAFRLAPMPLEALAADGETGWVHDAWRVGAGRRGLLFAAEPAAGAEVLRALVRAEASHLERPHAVLIRAEEWLGEELEAFLGVVDIPAQVLRFASRGDVFACLWGPGQEVEELTGRHDDVGVPIGGSETLVVASADAVTGEANLSFCEARSLRTGAALRVRVGQLVERVDEDTLILPVPGATQDAIDCAQRAALRAGLDEKEQFRLVAAVAEAVDNAERHAYLEGCDGSVEVRFLLTGDGVLVQVSDSGRGFDTAVADPSFIEGADLFRESGRGFQMIRRLVDAVEVRSASGCGTTVSMEKGYTRGHRD